MKVAKYWRNNALRYRLLGTVQSQDNYSLQQRPVVGVRQNKNHEVVTKATYAKVVA